MVASVVYYWFVMHEQVRHMGFSKYEAPIYVWVFATITFIAAIIVTNQEKAKQ